MDKINKIYFSYVQPSKFSGQTAATILIIDSLKKLGYNYNLIKLYPLKRSINSKILKYFNVVFSNIKSLPVIIRLLFEKKPILHLTLGQSYYSFLRIFIWLYPVFIIKRNLKIITSLNGSVFMKWDKNEFKCKFFLFFLKRSEVVTVLGLKQKSKLISLGINNEIIKIVPNACELNPVNQEILDDKHNKPNQFKILHLSSLIESKGFPEFLEAAYLLAKDNTQTNIEFFLCGPVISTIYCSKFRNTSEASDWIETKVELINSLNSNVKIKWIKGARGLKKERLFNEAHIFILPTIYPVEAQPLVLLEAMAAGCAIISTKVGEIESILNEDNSILIDDTSPENIKKHIQDLILDEGKRFKLATNGLKDYSNKYSLNKYSKTWEDIFISLSD